MEELYPGRELFQWEGLSAQERQAAIEAYEQQQEEAEEVRRGSSAGQMRRGILRCQAEALPTSVGVGGQPLLKSSRNLGAGSSTTRSANTALLCGAVGIRAS